MPKRLLNMSASDFAATSPMDLKQAILASEGRTIMAEFQMISMKTRSLG